MIIKIELPTGVNWAQEKQGRIQSATDTNNPLLTPKLNPNPTPRAALALGMQEKNILWALDSGLHLGLKERVGWG